MVTALRQMESRRQRGIPEYPGELRHLLDRLKLIEAERDQASPSEVVAGPSGDLHVREIEEAPATTNHDGTGRDDTVTMAQPRKGRKPKSQKWYRGE